VHPATLMTATNLAYLYSNSGRMAEALAAHERNLQQARALYGEGPHVEVANILGMASIAAWQVGRREQALRQAEHAWSMLAGVSAEDRDFLEWVGMLLGTLRMELGQPPDRALLQAPTRTCDTEAQSSFLQFRSCVAIAWLQVRDGDCGGVFEATPPSPIPAPDRLWWAAHQRLAAHCLPDPEGRRTASASALLDGLQAPPAWLTQPWH